jgi:aryl-alcohol dehydrogenase-like predicted oxidoreductase
MSPKVTLAGTDLSVSRLCYGTNSWEPPSTGGLQRDP